MVERSLTRAFLISVHSKVKELNPLWINILQTLALALLFPYSPVMIGVPLTIVNIFQGEEMIQIIASYTSLIQSLGLGAEISFAILTILYALAGVIIFYFGVFPFIWRSYDPINLMSKNSVISLGVSSLIALSIIEFQLITGSALVLLAYIGVPLTIVVLYELTLRRFKHHPKP